MKGEYSQRMEKELAVGRDIWLKFSYGNFILGEELLSYCAVGRIARGTGISPY